MSLRKRAEPRPRQGRASTLCSSSPSAAAAHLKITPGAAIGRLGKAAVAGALGGKPELEVPLNRLRLPFSPLVLHSLNLGQHQTQEWVSVWTGRVPGAPLVGCEEWGAPYSPLVSLGLARPSPKRSRGSRARAGGSLPLPGRWGRQSPSAVSSPHQAAPPRTPTAGILWERVPGEPEKGSRGKPASPGGSVGRRS